ncbi:chorismate mutase [Jhaorihella thermophila]|uniref:chorismate mutase n=1 Tax=Jhaorihella thermophila TaxID=488547 RepID=A0A1H5U8V8_9RHOB|nr:chorismate mutase [Jhaorihella thermophila]SEF70707.1 isochorismate pyruvate lyase [Jhaorihella thermophila]
MTQPIDPGTCHSMAELRRAIDALDGRIVRLLAHRAALIDRAVELKPAEGLPARIPERVQAVLDNVRSEARAVGLDPDLAARLWQILIEWSIAREERVLGTADEEFSCEPQ